VDREKLEKSQEDMEMSKEVREGLRIKGNKRQRSKKKIEEGKHTKRNGTMYCGKSMENP